MLREQLKWLFPVVTIQRFPHHTHLFIYLFETWYHSEELSQIGMSVEILEWMDLLYSSQLPGWDVF